MVHRPPIISSKEANALAQELRQDYQRARQRISYLKSRADKMYPDEYRELRRLEKFKGLLDDIINAFPETQRKIAYLYILEDMPLNVIADEVGYHYNWTLELRNQVMTTLKSVLLGDDIITSKIGLKVKEVIDRYDSN